MKYCVKCGTKLDDEDVFCRECGANASTATTDEPVVRETKPASKKPKEKGKNLVLAFLAAFFSFISVIWGLEYFTKDKPHSFGVVTVVLGVVILITFVLALLSRKRLISKIVIAISLILAAAIVYYQAVLLPSANKRIVSEYLEAMEDLDADKVLDIKLYPYDSLNNYFRMNDNIEPYVEVDKYLYQLYDDGKYSEWIDACYFVDETLYSDAWNETDDSLYDTSDYSCVFTSFFFKHMDEVCDKAREVDYSELQQYPVLFEDSAFADSELVKAQSVKKYINDLISGSIEEDPKVYFEILDNVLVIKMGDSTSTYFVIDLETGNYFFIYRFLETLGGYKYIPD